jgi:hypothetical protein
MKIRQFTNLPGIKTSLKIVAASGLAVGVVAGVSAVPASAASFNGGQLAFSDGTSDFFAPLNATAVGGSFTITFNPGNIGFINSNNLTVPSGTNTASSLIQFSTQTLPNSTGTFSRTSANTFTLTSPLAFAFSSGTSVNFASGNVFSLDTSNTASVSLSLTNGLGTIANGLDSTVSNTLGINLQDTFIAGGGTYGVIASPTAIPEPFTVIGTIIGGTVAFRMRKKLASSVNN